MKELVVVLVLFAVCHALILNLRHECKTNNDCPSTHCCVTDYHGEYCFQYQNETQPCHLTGHAQHLYKCGCKSGYTCEALHLTSGNILDPNGTLSQVEQILGHTGYGVCVKTTK